MSNIEFFTTIKAHKLLKKLQSVIDCRQVSHEYIIRSFHDSFDWRLYRHDLSVEFARSQRQSELMIRDLSDNTISATTSLRELPQFAVDIEHPGVSAILKKTLAHRALLEVCTLDYEYSVFEIFNKKQTLLARIHFNQYEIFKNHLRIEVLVPDSKRWQKHLNWLAQEIDLSPVKHPILHYALKAHGRKPKDYSSKLRIHLDADQSAESACRAIYQSLLQTIRSNENGIIHKIDSEFLHDYRVAVRRTQSGLRQMGAVLPEAERLHFLDFFKSLGEASNHPRDLDVHLLKFEQYKSLLPAEIRNDLNPLHNFLALRQEKAYQQLSSLIRSPEYLTALHEWEGFLKKEPQQNTPLGKKTIHSVAGKRLGKALNRCLELVNSILNNTGKNDFHELRISCKKLRYLLEFFEDLYPEPPLEAFIKNLRHCQDILGEAQDNRVYQQHLQQYREALAESGVHPSTLVAMDTLKNLLKKHESDTYQRIMPVLKDFYSQYHPDSNLIP